MSQRWAPRRWGDSLVYAHSVFVGTALAAASRSPALGAQWWLQPLCLAGVAAAIGLWARSFYLRSLKFESKTAWIRELRAECVLVDWRLQ